MQGAGDTAVWVWVGGRVRQLLQGRSACAGLRMVRDE